VGVFAPLADSDYFARVLVDEELGTIVWPDGQDMARAPVRGGRPASPRRRLKRRTRALSWGISPTPQRLIETAVKWRSVLARWGD
jgi:hypothetical protein